MAMDDQGHNFQCGYDYITCCRCGCKAFTLFGEQTAESLRPCPGRGARKTKMARRDEHNGQSFG